MTRILSLLLLLLAPLPLSAQVVTLPQAVSGQPGIPIPIVAVADGKNVVWVTPDKGLVVIDGAFFGGDSKKAMLFGPQGMYRLWAFTAKGDTVSINAECIVTIGTPTPPVPPTPTPNPPTPVSGLRVLILYESTDATDKSKLPLAQRDILTTAGIRAWLSTKCMPDQSLGSGKAWAMWDKDTAIAGMPKAWQAMMDKGKSLPTPSIVIAGEDGASVYAGPLPATIAETQALITKYAPATAPLRKAG